VSKKAQQFAKPEALPERRRNYRLQSDDEFTLDVLEGLGGIQATTKEVAAVLKVSEVTLMASFNRDPLLRERYERGKDHGRASLRRIQWELAKTNAAMAIFLGKNYLGQHDDTNHKFSGSVSVEVVDARERLAHFITCEAVSAGKGASALEIDASAE